MALREIVQIGEPVLRKKAKKVEVIDEKILQILDDMADTMYNADGVGLAAPQVGILKRIVVIDIGDGLLELINPEIIEDENDICEYGKSKEHRPNPIVQYGLFLDADGLPIADYLFSGKSNEQPSLRELEKEIDKDFECSRFIVVADAGLWYYVKKKCQLNRNFFYLTSTFEKC